MSGVRNVILLLSLLLLFLYPCVPQRSGREKPSDLTGRHENVKENHETAEKAPVDSKRPSEDGLATKEETVRFGTTVISYWRRVYPLYLAIALLLASNSISSVYFKSYSILCKCVISNVSLLSPWRAFRRTTKDSKLLTETLCTRLEVSVSYVCIQELFE